MEFDRRGGRGKGCKDCKDECDVLPPNDPVRKVKCKITLKDKCGNRRVKKVPALVGDKLVCDSSDGVGRTGLGAAAYSNRLWLSYYQQIQDTKEQLLATPTGWDELEGTHDVNVQKAVGFHKAFAHDACGELIDLENYKKAVCFLVSGDQVGLDRLVDYYASNSRLTDPWSGLATNHMGSSNSSVFLEAPPPDFEDTHAAEMVENYCMNLALDISFKDYETDQDIAKIIGFLNDDKVKCGLSDANGKLAATQNVQDWTSQNVFRGNYAGFEIGPHVSQFRLLNVATRNAPWAMQIYRQKFRFSPLLRQINGTQEYGISYGFSTGQSASQANLASNETHESASPGTARYYNSDVKCRYTTYGRDLGNWAGQDPTAQGEYEQALQLNVMTGNYDDVGAGYKRLGINPGIPSFQHNRGNSTAASGAVAQINTVLFCNLSRIHAYYWKWFQYRRLRPESAGLFTHNQKESVPGCAGGSENYGWPNWYINGDDDLVGFWDCVKEDNELVYKKYPDANKENVRNFQNGSVKGAIGDPIPVDEYCSYTYHTQGRGGAPSHPSYPAAHAYITGAAYTLLKFMYDLDNRQVADILRTDENGDLNPLLFPVPETCNGTNDVRYNGAPFKPLTDANPNTPGADVPVYLCGDEGKVILLENTEQDWTLNHEINKVMMNISMGRDWLGVHYRSDSVRGVYAGEEEAKRMFSDLLTSWYQDSIVDGPTGGDISEAPTVYFRRLNGCEDYVTVSSCVCNGPKKARNHTRGQLERAQILDYDEMSGC